jgi:hypothetical protein
MYLSTADAPSNLTRKESIPGSPFFKTLLGQQYPGRQRWLCRGNSDLVGHNKPFFADQGDSAVEERCVVIVVAN